MSDNDRPPATDPPASTGSFATRPPSDPFLTITPSATEDDEPASTIARGPRDEIPGYERLERIDEGAMGVVYKSRHRKLNRVVAIKLIKTGRDDSGSLLRFLAEAQAVAAIKHPNVVQVHESGEAQGQPFLVMEYLPGGTLARRLKSGKLEPVPAALLMAKLARAVQAAHDQEIVHRDLKPANVLFDESGEPRVTDFGLAKHAKGHGLTQTEAVMGTPAYMSPEQAEGKSKFVGPESDVYALGVILYECLTATRPFDHNDTHLLLDQIRGDEPEPPSQRVPGLPRDLELIALKCLAKEPADRYRTAGELADDLSRFTAGESVSVRAPSPAERAIKWAKRKPTLAATYALTLAVLGLIGRGPGGGGALMGACAGWASIASGRSGRGWGWSGWVGGGRR
jgi:serine/threonine protein kinase